MKEYRLAVYFGRFQPFHRSHKQVLLKGLELSDRVLIVLGSANSAPSIKNPFTTEERESIIRASCPEVDQSRLIFKRIRDYFYSDHTWTTNALAIVDSVAEQYDIPESEIGLLGVYKDSTSYYLDLFPWHKIPCWSPMMNATDVRKILFNQWCGLDDLTPYLEKGAIDWLSQNFIGGQSHALFIKEEEAMDSYKKAWENSPYPPTFVTTDAVVIKSGHVLMVRRKFAPGQGLLALPGGFLKQSERLEDCAIRELKEETRIAVPAAALREQIKSSKVFDYPGRSTRGRTITHAYLIDLGRTGPLPKVKGSDDAEHAVWVSILDLDETGIYEDHFHIIQSFISSQS